MDGFKEGYEFFAKNTGAVTGAFHGEEYIDTINSAINDVVKDFNNFEGYISEPMEYGLETENYRHIGKKKSIHFYGRKCVLLIC